MCFGSSVNTKPTQTSLQSTTKIHMGRQKCCLIVAMPRDLGNIYGEKMATLLCRNRCHRNFHCASTLHSHTMSVLSWCAAAHRWLWLSGQRSWYDDMTRRDDEDDDGQETVSLCQSYRQQKINFDFVTEPKASPYSSGSRLTVVVGNHPKQTLSCESSPSFQCGGRSLTHHCWTVWCVLWLFLMCSILARGEFLDLEHEEHTPWSHS